MQSLYEIATVAQQLLIDLAHLLVAQFFVLTCLFPFSSDLPLINLFFPFGPDKRLYLKFFTTEFIFFGTDQYLCPTFLIYIFWPASFRKFPTH